MTEILEFCKLFNALLGSVVIVVLSFYAGREFSVGIAKSGWVLLALASILAKVSG